MLLWTGNVKKKKKVKNKLKLKIWRFPKWGHWLPSSKDHLGGPLPKWWPGSGAVAWRMGVEELSRKSGEHGVWAAVRWGNDWEIQLRRICFRRWCTKITRETKWPRVKRALYTTWKQMYKLWILSEEENWLSNRGLVQE